MPKGDQTGYCGLGGIIPFKASMIPQSGDFSTGGSWFILGQSAQPGSGDPGSIFEPAKKTEPGERLDLQSPGFLCILKLLANHFKRVGKRSKGRYLGYPGDYGKPERGEDINRRRRAGCL